MRILCLGVPELVRNDLQERGCALFESTDLDDFCASIKICNGNFLDTYYIDAGLIFLGSRSEVSIFNIKKIRAKGIKLPIVGVTEGDLSPVIFLQQGGNYLITDPLNLSEIYESLSSLVQLVNNGPSGSIKTLLKGEFVVKLESRKVYFRDKLIQMSKVQFSILELFLEKPDRVITNEYIGEFLYGEQYENPNLIKTHIYNLRKRLRHAHDGLEELIHTVWGQGYRLNTSITLRAD